MSVKDHFSSHAEFVQYRHYTYNELQLILFESETLEDLEAFSWYIQGSKKSLSLIHLTILNAFFIQKNKIICGHA